MVQIQFGNHKHTEVTDDEGSTVTTDTDFTDSAPKSRLVRDEYKIRKRVYTTQDEREEYLAFSYEIEKDPSMFDTAFMIERSAAGNKNGYYYVVRCFSRLKY